MGAVSQLRWLGKTLRGWGRRCRPRLLRRPSRPEAPARWNVFGHASKPVSREQRESLRARERPLGLAFAALMLRVPAKAARPLLPVHKGWVAAIFYFFLHLGFFGLVILSALDSSFLTLPFANDILVIVLSSVQRDQFYLYAIGATVGSVIGSYVSYWVGAKGGETFIKAQISPRRYRQLHNRVTRYGPELLAVPAIIPPPFPYTAWVLAAGALEVPRTRFMLVLGAMRFARFFIEAVLAVKFGRGIVAWLNTPSFHYVIYFLVFVAIAASAYSIFRLVRVTRRPPRHPAHDDRSSPGAAA